MTKSKDLKNIDKALTTEKDKCRNVERHNGTVTSRKTLDLQQVNVDAVINQIVYLFQKRVEQKIWDSSNRQDNKTAIFSLGMLFVLSSDLS